ncbi:MAG: hypothetical protein CVV33_02255 [Methanomicrobiales archaeon HGW-Methanomicrobiales-4]|nr:MAG: hypothetical protein CVV33_02255 [Methanomicrobiales archaeon HGW-Methanomicrobiales-4]
MILIWICPVSASDSSPSITKIVFCTDLDDSGDPIDPIDRFPSGTSTVIAWFGYENIPQSPPWGYRLSLGNDLIQTGNYPMWAWDDDGSAHRDFSKEDGFEDGTYTLTFVMNNEEIGSGSFTIGGTDQDEKMSETKEKVSSGSFGRIIFAEGATDESAPIGEGDTFDAGITEIFMIIPYYGMSDGEVWSREWVLDGTEIASTEEEWDEGTEGITYRYLYNADGSPFSTGSYMVNLYLGDQVVRSACFTILSTEDKEQGTRSIKDLVDPDLMKAYDVLAYSDNKALRILSTLVPDNGITLGFSSDIPGTGQYRYSEPDDPGEIVISPDFWNEASWEEVAGTVAHELTHALQRDAKGGSVQCTVENEYLAFLFEFYALQESGRSDIFYDKFGGIFNSDGSLNQQRLWDAVKKAYSECPVE